jgi:hypothetical protein
VADELRLYLEQFKQCSLSIISMVEKENYDELDIRISERQEIIDSIGKLSFTKEEINSIAEELEIIALSERISSVINEKKILLRDKLQQNAAMQNANRNYNNNIYNNYHMLSKKI